MASCDACGANGATVHVGIWTGESLDEDSGSPRPPEQHTICGACAAWCSRVLGITERAQSGEIFGMPSAGARRVVNADQCRVCRVHVEDDGAIVALAGADAAANERSYAWLCGSCRAWLSEFLADLRSVRGLAERSIDGPYGNVIHGRLPRMGVAIAIEDGATSTLIAAICERMGAVVLEGGAAAAGPDAVHFLQANRDAGGGLSGTAAYPVYAIPLQAAEVLPLIAAPARADWITVPATPQQVAHVLQRVSRFPHGLPRDPGTALPVAVEPSLRNPVLSVTVEPGVSPAIVAWKLRRYARGYDEVVTTIDGEILVLPRCGESRAGDVARRLGRLVGSLATIAPRAPAARRQVDVSG